MRVEQTSTGDQLEELRIEGDEDELRTFALGVLEAIDVGERHFLVEGTDVAVICR